MTEPRFKPGDKLRVVRPYASRHPERSIALDEVVEVRRRQANGNISLVEKEGYWFPSRFEPARNLTIEEAAERYAQIRGSSDPVAASKAPSWQKTVRQAAEVFGYEFHASEPTPEEKRAALVKDAKELKGQYASLSTFLDQVVEALAA